MSFVRKYLPDTITLMNLLCGGIGVVFALQSRLDDAFYCMLAAAAFDFLDGAAARLLGSYSELGKELDSLSDVVSFGLLPSLMFYALMRSLVFGQEWLCFTPLVICLMSAFRLAKFNTDERQKDTFLGLPTPACALLCASLCCYVCYTPGGFLSVAASGRAFIPVLSLVLSVLLVSDIPFFSLKMHKVEERSLKFKRIALLVLVVLATVFCALLSCHWSLAVVIVLAGYILKNLVYALFKI